MPRGHAARTNNLSCNEPCQLTLKVSDVSERQAGVKTSSFRCLADDNLACVLSQTAILLFLISVLQ